MAARRSMRRRAASDSNCGVRVTPWKEELLNTKVKLTVALAIFGLAGAMALDARATTLDSPPSTEYFYADLPIGSELKWDGTGTVTILIDDVTFVGQPELPCPGDQICSIFDTTSTPSNDIGVDNSVHETVGDSNVWQSGALIVAGYGTYSAGMSSSSGSLWGFSIGREWRNSVELRDADSSGGLVNVIDAHMLAGAGFLAIREQEKSAAFSDFRLSHQTGTGGILDWDVSGMGAGGAGVGVGTGVGGVGWLTEVSSARHYQTPYIMQGAKIILVDTSGTSSASYSAARAIIKGRVITDSNDAPTVSTDVVVTTGS